MDTNVLAGHMGELLLWGFSALYPSSLGDV